MMGTHDEEVRQLVERWAEGRPLHPDSGKAVGYYRLTGFLTEYLERHGEWPRGVHAMPEGIDRHGKAEPSFTVDFDAIPGA